MVHRRSTYKLAFKNISCKVRKNIWEENSVLRERRRKDEMSHHSIDESDSECECDIDENEAEHQSEKKIKKHLTWSRDEENAQVLSVETDSDFYDDSDSGIERSKSSKGKNLSGSTSNLLPGSQKHTLKDSIDSRQEMLDGQRRYVSESSLPNAGIENSSKANRGVLKFMPSTGEIDLIPARLGRVKRPIESKKEFINRGNLRSSAGFCSTNKGCINVRPRSVVRFPGSSTSQPHYELKNIFGPRIELQSVRREPRQKTMDSSSVCLRCGQDIRMRGVMT